MPVLPGYTQFGGQHPETAALTNLLAWAGYQAPHTRQPYTEAMLLGLGGGLGAGYILWEFKAHQIAVLVLGFRSQWQYPQRFFETVTQRLQAPMQVLETGSRATAARQLDAALTASTPAPAIAWVDLAHMPYLQLPESLEGHLGHLVVVCGRDDDGAYWIDDRASQPFRVAAADLAAARARIGSYQHRLLLAAGGSHVPDLPALVEAGLRECVANLSAKSDSFSLPTLRKWSRLMTDTKNPKGWPVVFKSQRGLYTALKSWFESVELSGSQGGGLRGLYADFLDEAAAVLQRPTLSEAANAYRALAAQWTSLAEAALPDTVPAFAQTKQLLRRKYALLRQGQAGVAAALPITAELAALGRAASQDFPLDSAGLTHLFADLSNRLAHLYEAELAAVSTLTR
jgi:hypothetical protein